MTHEDSAAVWDGDDDVDDGQGRGSLVRRIKNSSMILSVIHNHYFINMANNLVNLI